MKLFGKKYRTIVINPSPKRGRQRIYKLVAINTVFVMLLFGGSYALISMSRENTEKLNIVPLDEVNKKNNEVNSDGMHGESIVNIEENTEYVDPGLVGSMDNILVSYEYYDGVTMKPVDKVDTSKTGSYYVYYRKNSSYNNEDMKVRVVNVYKKGTTPIQMVLLGKKRIVLEREEKYVEAGAKAYHKEIDISDQIIITDDLTNKKAGTYVLKYMIITEEGNVMSIVRLVTIKD